VAVLLDALDKLVRFNSSEPHISAPTAEITAARKALSGIRSPGVLCESDPFKWFDGEAFIDDKFVKEHKLENYSFMVPLYRKKE
jgi:hypothetical protein